MRRRVHAFVILLLGLCCSARVLAAPNPGADSLESKFHDFADLSLDAILDVTVTTAARHEQSLGEAPNAVTVVTAQEIHDYGYESLADVLRSLAGMHVTNDRNYENVGIRGFAPPGDYNTRVLLLVDGHPMNDILWNYAGIGTDSPVELSLIERIEILRGPSSALYGTNAIFGTINLITKKPSEASGLQFVASGGSFAQRQGSFSVGRAGRSPLRFLLGASSMNADGADVYFPEFFGKGSDGWVRGCDEDRYARMFLTAEWGPLTAHSLYVNRTKGIPTAPWDGLVGDPATETTDETALLDVQYEIPLRPNLGLLLRTYFHHYLYAGKWPWPAEDSTGVEERWFDDERETGDSGGLEARLDWQANRNHRILVGGEARRDLTDIDYDRLVPTRQWTESVIDHREESGFHAAYLQDELRIGRRLISTLGYHFDHYRSSGGKLTPSLGLVYDLSAQTRCKAIYGEGFKAPCYGEHLYYDEVTTVANPQLQPERYRSGELVLERKWSAALWTRLAAHRGEIEDLIRLIEIEDGMLQYRNTGRASLQGVELELRMHPIQRIEARGHLTRQEVQTLDPSEWAPNSPRWLGGLGIRYGLLRNGGSLAAELRYVGERRGVHAGVMVPAYLAADANLTLPLPMPGFEASFKISNLGDRRSFDPGGEEHRMGLIPQDGRTWRVSLRRTADTR